MTRRKSCSSSIIARKIFVCPGGKKDARIMDLKYQLLVFAVIFLGLFFVEYPPLFLIGYWSWGGDVHKVISGFFLILNLVVAEFARKRAGFASSPQKADAISGNHI